MGRKMVQFLCLSKKIPFHLNIRFSVDVIHPGKVSFIPLDFTFIYLFTITTTTIIIIGIFKEMVSSVSPWLSWNFLCGPG